MARRSIRVSPKLKWIVPYLEVGVKLIPRKNKVARVGAWTLGKSKGSKEHAAIFQDRVGDDFRIWLHTHYYDVSNSPAPFSKIDILKHLAHELAHTVDWKHTPKHSKLEAKITRAFMSLLESDGYISEEEELGT